MGERHRHLEEPQRIVVLTRAGLGDAVYVVPALRALRQRFPSAHITVITGDRGYPLLKNCPYPSEIHRRHLGKGARGKLQEILRLRKGRYDLAVILDTSDEKAVHTFLAGIPRRCGGVKGRFSRTLTDPVLIPSDVHQINEMARRIVQQIGCDVSDWKLELFPDPEAHQTTFEKLEEAGWHGERPLIGVNPGASAPNKQWFPDRFALVADTLLKQGAQVVLLGAQSDVPQAEAVLEKMHYRPLTLTGKLNLDELIVCLGQLDLLISGDTGPSHIAGAVGTPVVAVFGPSKALHYAPIGSPHIVLEGAHLCAPTCSFWTCRGDNRACMRSITAQDVLRATTEMLLQKKACSESEK